MADADGAVNIRQLFRAARGTPLGDTLRLAIDVLRPSLGRQTKDGDLAAFSDLQSLHHMPQDALNELQDMVEQGLPFFIQNELNNPANIPNLREWQKRFWEEAFERWNPAQWDLPAPQQRLLQQACTGSGKSDIITMAPFAGARLRCLIVVPNQSILKGVKMALGVAEPGKPGETPDERSAREQEIRDAATLRVRGLLSTEKPLPAVLVLADVKKMHTVIDEILASQVVLTTADLLRFRLPILLKWMRPELPHRVQPRPLFDLMITDEGHHYPAPSWIHAADQFRSACPGHTFNELLLTATPKHHKFGNLDDDRCRDYPQLTPFTLLDGMAKNVVKGVVLLEIQEPELQPQRPQPRDHSAGLQALMLAGEVLGHKMSGNPSIMHRALVVVPKIQHALDLVTEYEEKVLPEQRPRVLGVPMVVAAYYAATPNHPNVPDSVLERFSCSNQVAPIHCLIQVGKLAEGYDQPNISVAVVCAKIGGGLKKGGNKFAQFAGRAVRKLGASNLDPQLLPHKLDARDNIAHVVTHSEFEQLGLWDDFVRQQGFGEFDPDAVSDEEAADEDVADVEAEGDQQPPLQVARTARLVHRYVMAPTPERKNVVQQSERSQYQGPGLSRPGLWEDRWRFEDQV